MSITTDAAAGGGQRLEEKGSSVDMSIIELKVREKRGLVYWSTLLILTRLRPALEQSHRDTLKQGAGQG